MKAFLLLLVVATGGGTDRDEFVLDHDLTEADCMGKLATMPPSFILPEYGLEVAPTCTAMDAEDMAAWDETPKNADGQE